MYCFLVNNCKFDQILSRAVLGSMWYTIGLFWFDRVFSLDITQTMQLYLYVHVCK